MKMGAVIGQLIAQTQRPTGTNTDQKSSAGYRFLQSLEKGSVFEGTILEIKNGQVTIGLANGDLLHARLDMELSLIQGGSLFFQVKAADENQIALKPFPQETSNNPTLIKALQFAGVEVNSKNLAMVSLMMEEQLPIDKNSVLAMAKAVMDSPQSDMRSLIQMVKYQIPVSEKNVAHFEELKDHQLYMVKNLNTVMSETSNLVSHFLEGTNQTQNNRQLVDFLNLFAGESVLEEADAQSPLMRIVAGDTLVAGEPMDLPAQTTSKTENSLLNYPVDDQASSQELPKNNQTIPDASKENFPLQNQSLDVRKDAAVILDENQASQIQSQSTPGKEVLSLEKNLNEILSGWKHTTKTEAAQDPKTFAKVVQDLTMALSKEGYGEASVFDQLTGPTKKLFREFVNQLLERAMTTTPEALEKTPEFSPMLPA